MSDEIREEAWDFSERSDRGTDDDGQMDSNTFIRVNGSNIAVDPGTAFKDVVKDAARNAGLGKFRVHLNGEEIRPSDAPEVVQEGMRMELRPYDVAGIRIRC